MKQKYITPDVEEEFDFLSNELHLDPMELYVLGFMKGFDRKKLREWQEKGLMDFSIKY